MKDLEEKSRFASRWAAWLALAGGWGAVLPASAQTYQISAVNPLSGDQTSIVMGINNAGALVGTSYDAEGDGHAFILQGGTQTALATLGGATSEANGIGSNGQIAGSSALSSGLTHACSWASGSAAPVDADPANAYGTSRGSAINGAGTLAGYYQTSQNLPQGFVSNATGLTAVNYPAAAQTQVYGLNDEGAVVGSFTGASMVQAFVQSGSSWLALPNATGGTAGQANAVNLNGLVAGWVIDSSGDEQAATWQNGTLTLLGDLGGGYGEAVAANNFGQVVGASHVAASSYNYAASYSPNNNVSSYESAGSLAPLDDSLSHAFLYQNGTMTDLNSYLPQGSPWILERATGINDAGQIVGYGTYDGVVIGFVLTPQNSPVSGAGTLALTESSYSIDKNDGTATITVTRTGGTTGTVSALVGITTGTAVPGTNFGAVFETVTFADGQGGSQTITIPITDDPSIVISENFGVRIFQVTGGATTGTTSAATVTIVAPPFDTWRGANFSTAQLADTSISGEAGTPAHDGVPNLLKYALGLDPWQPAVDAVTTAPDPTQNYLQLSYTAMKSATDVSLTVQVSSDLVNWSSGSSATTTTSTIDNGASQTVTVQSNTAISDTPRQFMRLQATRLP